MPAGRPPKSDEEKKRRGTYRPSRSTGNEIAPPPVVKTPRLASPASKSTPVPDPPKRKRGRPRKNPVGAQNIAPSPASPPPHEKLFDDTVQIMTAYKTLTDWDYHMITLMCNEYKNYIDHKDEPKIEINPISSTSAESAASKITKKALDNFTKLAVQLGVTNIMRMRIRVKSDDDTEEDPLLKLLNGKT